MNRQPPDAIVSTCDARALHRFAVFTAGCAFLLIIAGGLVTSNDAGLAVPDWPLSYGRLMPPMVGGIFYEHGHRMVATFVGMLTVVLALWIWRRERRPWVRRLGWINLAAIIVQGLLGGITVLYLLPKPVSIAHASLAQAVLCMTAALALVTGRRWHADLPRPRSEDDGGLRTHSIWLTTALYGQLILGAAARHAATGPIPHIVGACVVLGLAAWTAWRASTSARGEWLRPAAALASLVTLQFLLGVFTLLIKLDRADAPQPTPDRVWSATAHVALGALVLVGAMVFCLRVHRRYRSPLPGPAATASQPLAAPLAGARRSAGTT